MEGTKKEGRAKKVEFLQKCIFAQHILPKTGQTEKQGEMYIVFDVEQYIQEGECISHSMYNTTDECISTASGSEDEGTFLRRCDAKKICRFSGLLIRVIWSK